MKVTHDSLSGVLTFTAELAPDRTTSRIGIFSPHPAEVGVRMASDLEQLIAEDRAVAVAEAVAPPRKRIDELSRATQTLLAKWNHERLQTQCDHDEELAAVAAEAHQAGVDEGYKTGVDHAETVFRFVDGCNRVTRAILDADHEHKLKAAQARIEELEEERATSDEPHGPDIVEELRTSAAGPDETTPALPAWWIQTSRGFESVTGRITDYAHGRLVVSDADGNIVASFRDWISYARR